MANEKWVDVGPSEDFKKHPLTRAEVGKTKLAISFVDGKFGAISDVCNHVGGPLSRGKLKEDYVVCPWHHWKFHRLTGEGEPGYEEDKVPAYKVKEEGGRLYIDKESGTKRNHLPKTPHPLTRRIERKEGPIRVVGISTTVMDPDYPRYSTSEALLEDALSYAAKELGAETNLIRVNDLKFRSCEGYYSLAAEACTWPCSITQMDSDDEMTEIYEALVFWGDVVIVSTPIRWGNASSLYYKMIERLNCVQNQITIRNKFLIQKKVASFIITGGQDNIQSVAGEMMMFFGEIGFHLPHYPFVAHSRGWTAEDMENNMIAVQQSEELRKGTRALVKRSVDLARLLLGLKEDDHVERGGRKAHRLT